MDELGVLRETARALLERNAPIARVRELEGANDPALWRLIAEAGWLAMALPEGVGGGGAGLREVAIVAEELGRSLAAGGFVSSVIAARAIASAGDDGDGALAQIAAGQATAALCLAEPGYGWDAGSAQTAVGRDGTVTGRKALVFGATEARWLVVTTAGAGGEAGLFLVDAAAGGVEVHPTASLDLTRRFADVELRGAPARQIGGAAEAARVLEEGAALACAETVGAARRLLEMTASYARERVQFGRPIGSFQAVKHRCANMLVSLEASAAATQAAVRALDASSPDAAREVSAAKASVGDACATLAADALQVHGGIGFTWEMDVHLYLRRIRSDRALFGTPAWHRDRLYALATA